MFFLGDQLNLSQVEDGGWEGQAYKGAQWCPSWYSRWPHKCMLSLTLHCTNSEEWTKHQLTHLPYRPWCAACVAGKGKTQYHRKLERG